MSIRTQRNSRRLIGAAVAVAVAASTFAISNSPVSATATASVDARVAGADRYATSVAIATATAGAAAGTFVIASGDNYPDALAASALAGALNARIILVPSSGELSTGARGLLTGATTVRIVGGTSAVATALETTLTAAAPTGLQIPAANIKRISGATRYETAAAISAEIQNITPAVAIGRVGLRTTAILVSGQNFADAVAAAPLAYRGPAGQAAVHPVLLTEPNALNASAAQRLVSLGVQQVVIVGGPSAVSPAVEAAVAALGINVIRVGGANRYETAANLATVAITPEAAGGFGWPRTAAAVASLAPAGGGADALAAAPWLGKNPRVLLGVNPSGLPAATASWLDANKATVANLTVFGGTAAVPATVVDAALTSAGRTAAPTATIAALEGATSVSITFSEAVVAASATNIANYSVFNSAEIKALSAGAYNATTRTVTFTVAPALAVGDFVRVLNSTTPDRGVLTADGRKVAAAELIVAADTTAPVGTLTARVGIPTVGVTNTFAVSFDKPVKTVSGADLVNADFTVNGVATTINTSEYTLAGVEATNAQFDTVTITLTAPAPLTAGQTVALLAGKVRILGAAATTNAAVSGTVEADLVRPAVVGIPVATLVKSNAVGTIGTGNAAVNFVADKTATSGIPGNSVTVTFTAGDAGTAPAVSVEGNAITVTNVASKTAAVVAAAINANAQASALVTAAAAGDGAGTVADGIVNLAGGSEYVSVVFNFTEEVTLGTEQVFKYQSGGAGSPVEVGADTAAPTVTLATSGASVTVRFGITNVNQRPVANAATYTLDAGVVSDVAGNPNAAVAAPQFLNIAS